MKTPAEILNASDLKNYRNIRAVSILYVLLGSVLVLGGVVGLTIQGDKKLPHPAFFIALVAVGLAGAVGGIAALRGKRGWARLVYIIAAIYICAFPVGTILSVTMFRGLSRYLNSVERLRSSSD